MVVEPFIVASKNLVRKVLRKKRFLILISNRNAIVRNNKQQIRIRDKLR